MSSEHSYVQERLKVREGILRTILEEVPVACSKGCVYCCYGVTLWLKRPEALVLVEYLNGLSLKERKRVAKKLKEYERIYRQEAQKVGYDPPSPLPETALNTEKLGLIGGLGMNDVPCPFLSEDRTCAVYEARPDMCRLMLFRDSEVCRADWEDPMRLIWQREIAPFVERIRERFASKWSLAVIKLQKKYPELDLKSLEEEVGFITHWIRFDPVKKLFRFRG